MDYGIQKQLLGVDKAPASRDLSNTPGAQENDYARQGRDDAERYLHQR